MLNVKRRVRSARTSIGLGTAKFWEVGAVARAPSEGLCAEGRRFGQIGLLVSGAWRYKIGAAYAVYSLYFFYLN